MKRSTSWSKRGAIDGVVEAVVDLGERVWELVEVADAADDRGEMDHKRAALHRHARLLELTQVAGVHLAALAHPLRGWALVRDTHVVCRVCQEPSDDRGADRTGAAGDEHTGHRLVPEAFSDWWA